MATLADAVESGPQRNRLRSRRCTEAQGYFFASSVPTHAVVQVLAAGAARQAA